MKLHNQNLNRDSNKSDPSSSGNTLHSTVLQKRSRRYMDALTKIDSITTADGNEMHDLLHIVQEEFNATDHSDLPLGIVAKCFLGHPHEIHTLDLIGKQLITHYNIGDELPLNFEKARNLANHKAYAFVEVYRDKIILIREDGAASLTLTFKEK